MGATLTDVRAGSTIFQVEFTLIPGMLSSIVWPSV